MTFNKVLVPSLCSHRGEAVQVGPFEIHTGGMQHFQPGDAEGFDLLIPLCDRVPLVFGGRYQILAATLVDYGGVPEGWRGFIEEVIKELIARKKILTYCVGSHGRTGCFLGSLIALLETPEETPDPIKAVRKRHCYHAVETRQQAEAIFSLRGMGLPQIYLEEFSPPPQPVRKGKK